MPTEPTRSVTDIIAQLQRDADTERSLARRRRARIALLVVGLALLWRWIHVFPWWLWVAGGVGVTNDLAMLRRRRAASAQQLGNTADPIAIGPLLAVAVRDSQESVRRAARDALCKLLPRARADTAAQISAGQMECLVLLMQHGSTEFTIAGLQALEQVGDDRTEPLVEQLATSRIPAVRSAALRALPFVQQRATIRRDSAMLLRAAGAAETTASPAELLRSAGAAAVEPAE
ncbi:MAG: hypothetical protein KGK12_00470, partial [Armatimonadetes bacterium]|nr:hypothetical protein [Armatimonadota bacterium]